MMAFIFPDRDGHAAAAPAVKIAHGGDIKTAHEMAMTEDSRYPGKMSITQSLSFDPMCPLLCCNVRIKSESTALTV